MLDYWVKRGKMAVRLSSEWCARLRREGKRTGSLMLVLWRQGWGGRERRKLLGCCGGC